MNKAEKSIRKPIIKLVNIFLTLDFRCVNLSIDPRPGGHPLTEEGGIFMKGKDNKDVLLRVRNIIGHLKGVEKMIEEEKYCIDIINQISAVQSSLKKLSDQMLETHLNSCVRNAIKKGDDDEVLEELMEVFKHRGK